jgi:uncharacterized protein
MFEVLRWFVFPGVRRHRLGMIPSPPLVRICNVPCLRIRPAGLPAGVRRPVLLYFHGNGGDLYTEWRRVHRIANGTGMEVVCMEYRGYGIHPGPAEPAVIVAEGQRVLRQLHEETGRPVRVLGYSIGTGVATEVAAKCAEMVHSLALVAPFESIAALVTASAGHEWTKAFLPNGGFFNTVRHLRTTLREHPKLLIHGERDALIPAYHSATLLNATHNATRVTQPTKGHDDVRFDPLYSWQT